MSFVVERLGRVESTNDEAARRAREGAPHGTVIVAAEQTRGRGTKGRSWRSPPGGGLYLSLILRPDVPAAELPPLTLAIGIGVCDACRSLGGAADLKWPNDVLVGGRKLAGILVEAQTRGDRVEHVVAGVGVNVGIWDDTVASLACGVDEALAAVLPALERAVARFVDEGTASVVRAFKERCPLLGRRVEVDEGGRRIAGILEDIDPDGAIVVDGRRIVSGEVST